MQEKLAQEHNAKLLAMPLRQDAMKGKIDLKYYGHAGFKISFNDHEEKQRCIYINVFVDNPDCPMSDRTAPPNDCDVVCVSHGQIQHSMHAPFLA